jgi:hypothetical protein
MPFARLVRISPAALSAASRRPKPSHGAPSPWAPRHRAPAQPRRHRAYALLLPVIAALVPAGIAYAYWSTSGSGSGSAAAVSAQPLDVSATTVTPDLYPGATGSVAFSATNPNSYPVTITGGSVSAITDITGSAGSCAASDFTLGTGTVASTTIPAGGNATVTLAGAITMNATAGDGCQSAQLTVSGTLTGTQS